MIGTRFEATHEALLDAEESKAITAAQAADTIRGRIHRYRRRLRTGRPRYTARTLRNAFHRHMAGSGIGARHPIDDGLGTSSATAVERGDLDYVPIWAGEAVDLIAELESASALVARIAEDAARTITETANAVHDA